MPSPSIDDPPPEAAGHDLPRQRFIIKCVIGLLLLMALLVLTVVPRIGTPLRLFVAASDTVLAAVLWLVLRQKFRSR